MSMTVPSLRPAPKRPAAAPSIPSRRRARVRLTRTIGPEGYLTTRPRPQGGPPRRGLPTRPRVPPAPPRDHRIQSCRGGGGGLFGRGRGDRLALRSHYKRTPSSDRRENLVVVTQPGPPRELKKRRAEGLFYSPDPRAIRICSIVGNLGTNAGGLSVKSARPGSVLVWMSSSPITRYPDGVKYIQDVPLCADPPFVGSRGRRDHHRGDAGRGPTPRTRSAFFPTLASAGDAVGRSSPRASTNGTPSARRPSIAAVADAFNLGRPRRPIDPR